MDVVEAVEVEAVEDTPFEVVAAGAAAGAENVKGFALALKEVVLLLAPNPLLGCPKENVGFGAVTLLAGAGAGALLLSDPNPPKENAGGAAAGDGEGDAAPNEFPPSFFFGNPRIGLAEISAFPWPPPPLAVLPSFSDPIPCGSSPSSLCICLSAPLFML